MFKVCLPVAQNLSQNGYTHEWLTMQNARARSFPHLAADPVRHEEAGRPDKGQRLTSAVDALLAALALSAPPPKSPLMGQSPSVAPWSPNQSRQT